MKLEDAIKATKFSSQKHKAMLNVLYTAWWLKTAISRELKKIGLTEEQYNVLRILKGKYPEQMCVRDIGSRMIEANSNVPRIVDRLVAKSLVNRSTSNIDKRETVISLTNAGMNILENANNKVDDLVSATVTISEKDAALISNLLESMREGE